ncbi:MAG TPA: glycosyltransferase family 4 protein [Chloroflexota bacterium]|nr:glycosyltransferase family 4 protein [Chloroflexota bacterium]
MLRVAHVVATFPPYWGGTGNVAFHNALELARRGLGVTVLTAAAPTRDWTDPPEFAVRRLPTPFRFGNAPFLPSLLGALGRFDLVHLHWPFIFGAELTWLACRLAGVPYVVTYHHDLRADLRWQFGPYQALVGPLLIGGASRVLPVSLDHFRASPMFRHAAARRRPIVEIPNGVDVGRFRPDVDGAGVRRELAIPADAVVVGYLGAMDKAHAFKGVPVLLEAIARLEGRGVHLLAVGGGELQPTYRRQADRLGLTGRAHWTGAVGAEELPAHLAAMDVLVLPSLGTGAESFGIVLIEAMASGKPVVASALPGVRRVVDEGRNGFLVPPGDPDKLAVALSRLSDDPELRRSLGAAGRAKAESHYDWRRIAARLETEYRTVVDRAG